jgi:hypothetical protein
MKAVNEIVQPLRGGTGGRLSGQWADETVGPVQAIRSSTDEPR